ncbi:hypothetical protein [Maridesulfovibrio salexigens]|uniref:Uncharacterized protein n=1 Tax=Maridesulfovibrio salexigens (strain ATCC 14822 / DSM 2638 / NCIMB 8403 / VKM B-1763) TaxID=526222 RepID=C6C0J9_MARSD|nr:hypothetical protein [Maridesulfovibrio salexigens]ACS79133.1 hypothetical protein Desal_1069 [Maridesulfovibrio salexigens DSM 2638]
MDDSKFVDLKAVSCGLVPIIVNHLDTTSNPVVEFQIRLGIREEILSGFGTGGKWDIEVVDDLGCDRLRFTRRKESNEDRLNIVEY